MLFGCTYTLTVAAIHGAFQNKRGIKEIRKKREVFRVCGRKKEYNRNYGLVTKPFISKANDSILELDDYIPKPVDISWRGPRGFSNSRSKAKQTGRGK